MAPIYQIKKNAVLSAPFGCPPRLREDIEDSAQQTELSFLTTATLLS
jgi:hypothetical protein